MLRMLRLGDHLLPNSSLTYMAFRVAFCETLRAMREALRSGEPAEGIGFLTEVPFLRNVAPQVQLSELARTWARQQSRRTYDISIIDEAVFYAACEHTAGLAELSPERVAEHLFEGPREIFFSYELELAALLRQLYLLLPNEGDFLLISQFEDLPPRQARRLKREYGILPGSTYRLMRLLGRWRVPAGVPRWLRGLLDDAEIAESFELMQSAATWHFSE